MPVQVKPIEHRKFYRGCNAYQQWLVRKLKKVHPNNASGLIPTQKTIINWPKNYLQIVQKQHKPYEMINELFNLRTKEKVLPFYRTIFILPLHLQF